MAIPYGRPQVRTPDWSRIKRANAPRLMGAVPALNVPRENANVILNKQVATLNRAGSNPGNPILSGLGVRIQIGMGLNDRLIGLYLFQEPGARGANLVSEAAIAGQYATFGFQAGGGRTVAGDPTNGAAKNFVRWITEAGGNEKEFWIKSYDSDVVKAADQACLDPDTLLPVAIDLGIVDAGRDWIVVPVDFMPSWADEFQALGDPSGQQGQAGFKKAYGGALFVSFFDTATGIEGVGVQVNPITIQAIADTRSIEVENTEGLKEITVRFRSEAGSPFYVDVPIQFTVEAPDEEPCDPPASEPCSSVYLPVDTALPADCPSEPSEPGVQVEAGVEGEPLDVPLLVVSLHGTLVGAAPKLRVRKYEWVANAQAIAGADLQQVGDDEDYLPLVLDGDAPVLAPPYGDPHRMTIAFSTTQLAVDNVAFISVAVLDGDHLSSAVTIPAPRARAVATMPIGGLGGGTICAY